MSEDIPSLTCINSGNNMEPFVETLLQRLLPILSSVKASPNLLENTAVTIGRLALAAPQTVAPHLGEIIRLWSQTMVHVSAGPEQDAALRGICEAAKYNPSAITEGGPFLLQALGRSENPSDELRTLSAPVGSSAFLARQATSKCALTLHILASRLYTHYRVEDSSMVAFAESLRCSCNHLGIVYPCRLTTTWLSRCLCMLRVLSQLHHRKCTDCIIPVLALCLYLQT